MKGVLITTKEPVFKQRNKISKIPPYPMFLKELTVIDSLKMDYLELHHIREGEGKVVF